jgi:hypothetical protein
MPDSKIPDEAFLPSNDPFWDKVFLVALDAALLSRERESRERRDDDSNSSRQARLSFGWGTQDWADLQSANVTAAALIADEAVKARRTRFKPPPSP